MTCGTPSAAQERALLGAAGGGEDLGARTLRELDRGQPDAAGGRVDQHALARRQLGQAACRP